MTTAPDELYHRGGVPVGGLEALGMGNVYYVMQSANALYNTDFFQSRIGTYADGSERTHTTIQAALDATVANRNDYVIVMPDSADYDITAALTMTKRNVHLICPGGLGSGGFPTNAARVHQNTAATAMITVTADCVEIAGFFFKHMTDSNGIVLSGTRWHPIIHDNFFGMACASTGTAAYGVGGTGAISHASIYRNYFTNYSPGAMSGTNNALSAFIKFSSATCTRGLIRDNLLHTGGNTTVATGIQNAGYGMFIINNYLWEDVAFGGTEAGIFTLGISNSVDSFCANNMIGIATANDGVSGGTANQSYTHNYEGTSGGTALT